MVEQARVLVVEDDESIAAVLVDLLADEGYDARRARGGREALEVLGAWVPDVILLDLMLPDMDGVQFRAAQRGLGGRAGAVPVVVLSGSYQAGESARDLAAAGIIAKPFDLDDVTSTVARFSRRPAA